MQLLKNKVKNKSTRTKLCCIFPITHPNNNPRLLQAFIYFTSPQFGKTLCNYYLAVTLCGFEGDLAALNYVVGNVPQQEATATPPL